MKTLKNWIFFLISLTTLSALAMDPESCTVSDKNCNFYRCMEKNHPCGKNGYWQDFGTPYCEFFVKDEKKFSPNSQIWLQDVRLCLQTRLRESVDGLQCGEIKNRAIDDHVSCYVDTGFCQLTAAEQIKIMWYLKGALRDYRTWKEAELLRRACQRP